MSFNCFFCNKEGNKRIKHGVIICGECNKEYNKAIYKWKTIIKPELEKETLEKIEVKKNDC